MKIFLIIIIFFSSCCMPPNHAMYDESSIEYINIENNLKPSVQSYIFDFGIYSMPVIPTEPMIFKTEYVPKSIQKPNYTDFIYSKDVKNFLDFGMDM